MTIKLARACRLARKLPRAEAEILGSIPQTLRDGLTSKQLAALMDALDCHWHKAVAWRDREILGDGYIYDPTSEQLRDLAPSVSPHETARIETPTKSA